MLTGAGAGVSARGAALALSGLLHVARSLTSNARGVFRILAERQIDEKENKENEKTDGQFAFFRIYVYFVETRHGSTVCGLLILRHGFDSRFKRNSFGV